MAPGAVELVHATALALGPRAALICGPSGSGKSDLALRCLMTAASPLVSEVARLISDDQVLIRRAGDLLLARAPETISGKLEVRGLGIIAVPAAPETPVALVVELCRPEDIDRLPLSAPTFELMGLRLPLLKLAAFEASAAAKLLMALSRGV